MRSTRAVADRLLDMLNAIASAREATADLGLEAFRQDGIRRLATERAIEIISEASRHVPTALKEREPDIPWRDIGDIGNILRHVYDRADPEVVWRVVQFDLAPLEQALKRLLERTRAEP